MQPKLPTQAANQRIWRKNTFEGIDMPKVNEYRDGVVARLYKGLQGLIKSRDVTFVEGEGKLVGANTVEVNGVIYTGKNVVLATGSYARSIPGLDISGRIMTSDQALDLDYVPKSVIVLGGGVIGVEFASVWKSFGADVTVVEGLPHLVPNEDEAASKALERAYRKRGINLILGTKFASATQNDSSVEITLEDGKVLSAELLLVAVGRGANTANMGYEETMLPWTAAGLWSTSVWQRMFPGSLPSATSRPVCNLLTADSNTEFLSPRKLPA